MVQPIVERPKRTGLKVGGVLLALGVVLFIGGIVGLIATSENPEADYQRAPATGGSVYLDEAGEWSVYVEFRGANAVTVRGLTPRITSNEGRDVFMEPALAVDRYDRAGRDGLLIGSIVAPAPGAYDVVAAESDPTGGRAIYAFGRDEPDSSVPWAWLLMLTLGFPLGFAGIVTLVVSGIRAAWSSANAAPAWMPPQGRLPSWSSGTGGRGPVMLESDLPPPPPAPAASMPTPPSWDRPDPPTPPPRPPTEPPPLPGADDPSRGPIS